MEKKEYESPAMEIVQLQNTGMLMTSGELGATMDGVFVEGDI